MKNILFLSIVFVLGFSGFDVLSNKKDEKVSQTDNKEVKVKVDTEGFTVTRSLTLDEAAEAFGTPSRKEIIKDFEEKVKEEGKKGFFARLYHTFFVVLPGLIF